MNGEIEGLFFSGNNICCVRFVAAIGCFVKVAWVRNLYERALKCVTKIRLSLV